MERVSRIANYSIILTAIVFAFLPFIVGEYGNIYVNIVAIFLSGIISALLLRLIFKLISESRTVSSNHLAGIVSGTFLMMQVLLPMLALLYISMSSILFHFHHYLEIAVFSEDPSRLSVFIFVLDQAL